MEQLTIDLIALFLRDCSDQDHQHLIDTESYLRFMLCCNTPEQYPYAYGYIRDIKNCVIENQKTSIISM